MFTSASLAALRWMRSVRHEFSRAGDRAARLADPLCRTWVSIFVAGLVLGIGPVLACAFFRSPLHQVLTALAIAPLLWSCARRENVALGMGLLAITFAWHCCTMIEITRCDPAIGAILAPDGEDYWLKQQAWIKTGIDREYEWKNWGPAHALLFCGTTLYSLTSLGVITLLQGFYEVDLMNYYNGRLMLISREPWLALCYGWHVWSLLRGFGYVILTYELTSLGLQLAIGRSLADSRVRTARWAAGAGFLLLDATAKWYLLELIRQQLLANLL